jgi:hypothetical protein
MQGRDRAREGNQKLECGWCAHCTGMNTESLNWPRATMRSGLGRSEEDWRGESIGAAIHICMGTTQGNCLCSCLYLKLAKCHVSPFIYYNVFSSTKSENRMVEQVLLWEGGMTRKGVGGWMWCKQCVHVCKCKTDTCWNCSSNQRRGDRGKFKYTF